MDFKDGNFIITKEELEPLLSTKAEEEMGVRGYYNPERIKVVWAYLNSRYTEGKKLPITPKQYRELIKALYKTLDADMRRNFEKYVIAFKIATDYARGVGRGTYHYLAELYALKANIASYSLIRIVESLTAAKQEGHPEGLEILLSDGTLIDEAEGVIKDFVGEDGKTHFTYGGRTTQDIEADMRRGLQYLYANMRGFKADIEGITKCMAELIPPQYLEPFSMEPKNLLPLSLRNYIYKMEKGFIEEVGVDICETAAGKYKIYPTYSAVKVHKASIELQYKLYKKTIEDRWRNE